MFSTFRFSFSAEWSLLLDVPHSILGLHPSVERALNIALSVRFTCEDHRQGYGHEMATCCDEDVRIFQQHSQRRSLLIFWLYA